MSDRPPDPVDIEALRQFMDAKWGDTYGDPCHSQVPETYQVKVMGDRLLENRNRQFSPLGCAAHGAAQHCCLDYFYDTIRSLLDENERVTA